ncbi:hypothetical protein [Rathayibacter sp. Leaf296]|uniref:hypothetical protein n=1 Tax=Rathayibacter sp. Leaf296 TaxID=1736327 RepID=UPI000702E93D|nr:hypothetical protein [Rathayibacter sp. Leaf296]KQQ07319.1 hypothetical protein ASF46_16710 [Rathayibacter sp. Leaf296]
MIPTLSSRAMFVIGLVAVALRVLLIDIAPFVWGPYQGSSPTLALLLQVLSITAGVASGVGYAFLAGAFVVRHLEVREEAERRRSVHFVGRSAAKE